MPDIAPGLHIPTLFHRLSAGDEEAFTLLFHHYSKQIFPFLVQKLRSDQLAEELLQDIFLRLWVYRSRLAAIQSPEGYLFRIAANRVRDHFREQLQRDAMARTIRDAGPPAGTHPNDAMDMDEAKRILREGVGLLPPQRKKVYELKQEGLRYEEIATMLGISTNTVKNQLVEANRFLLEFLRDRGLPILLLILSWQRP